jgi:hypothetical protein
MNKLENFLRFNPDKKKLILDVCEAIRRRDTVKLDIKRME